MTAATTPQLLICTPTGVERFSLLDQSTWTLGRHPSNSIPLKDNSISRYHAKLEVLQEECIFLVDLNSRNGSTVNQQPVSKPVLLKHGDRLHLGRTEFLFEQSLFFPPEHPTDVPQVVMLHDSALQGKIWQDVLLSQKLSVRWVTQATNLQYEIEQGAVVQQLPNVLLIDVQAYCGDLEAFCRWSQQQHPDLAILLIDSEQRQIPLNDRQQMTSLGCIDFLPAFREPNLLDNVAGVVVHLNLVLRAFNNQTLRQDKLFLSLKKLEDLLKLASSLPTATSSATPPSPSDLAKGTTGMTSPVVDLQDFTMISRHSRK